MKIILLTFKNGVQQEFEEKHLDCHTWTLAGHVAHIIDAWQKRKELRVYKIDEYTAIDLDELLCVRLI